MCELTCEQAGLPELPGPLSLDNIRRQVGAYADQRPVSTQARTRALAVAESAFHGGASGPDAVRAGQRYLDTAVERGGTGVIPSQILDRNARVTLPRHEVWMLRQGFEELLKWAILERDCFFNSITNGEGQVQDKEDAITLAEQDLEISRAQRALKAFDRVFHG